MATVLRVKRRNDDQPQENLLISYKRPKLDDDDDDDDEENAKSVRNGSAVAKFTLTVKDSQDEALVEHIGRTLSMAELKTNFKKHSVDIQEKARTWTQDCSKENRFKVISALRSLPAPSANKTEDKVLKVVDIEDSLSCAAKQDSSAAEDGDYVYDLYYATTDDVVVSVDECVSVHMVDQELVFEPYREHEAYSDNGDDSENSNSENNWKNDYPDSEDSITEDDMRNACESKYLFDPSDLSGNESDLLYELDENDVNNYGYRYAKYKKKILKTMNRGENNTSSSSSDEEEPFQLFCDRIIL